MDLKRNNQQRGTHIGGNFSNHRITIIILKLNTIFANLTATSEGSIPMAENEELHLIELDQGDGWTRVRRINGNLEEGFVPTTYIETTLFNT